MVQCFKHNQEYLLLRIEDNPCLNYFLLSKHEHVWKCLGVFGQTWIIVARFATDGPCINFQSWLNQTCFLWNAILMKLQHNTNTVYFMDCFGGYLGRHRTNDSILQFKLFCAPVKSFFQQTFPIAVSVTSSSFYLLCPMAEMVQLIKISPLSLRERKKRDRMGYDSNAVKHTKI